MELAPALVISLALVAAPTLTILAMRQLARDLAQQLTLYLRQAQGTGEPVSIIEQRLKLESDKVELAKQQTALKAAEMLERRGIDIPGAQRRAG